MILLKILGSLEHWKQISNAHIILPLQAIAEIETKVKKDLQLQTGPASHHCVLVFEGCYIIDWLVKYQLVNKFQALEKSQYIL